MRYTDHLQSHANLTVHLNQALGSLHAATEMFPRKHRLNPDDTECPSCFAEGTYQMLVATGEMLVAAMEINQKAIPIPEGHACLPYFSEPLRQAAVEAMARATRRRLDNERDSLIRMGMEVPETHLRTEAGEVPPDSQSTGNAPSGDCPPL